MYALPELFFRLADPSIAVCGSFLCVWKTSNRRIGGKPIVRVEEVWEISQATYGSDLESLRKEFFIAAKPHPCKKGIYYYLHECNFPKLLSMILQGKNIQQEQRKPNVLILWLTTVMQVFGISISPKVAL